MQWRFWPLYDHCYYYIHMYILNGQSCMCTISVCGYTEEMICFALEHTGRTQTTRGHVSSDEDGSFAATELCNTRERTGAEHQRQIENIEEKETISHCCWNVCVLVVPVNTQSLSGWLLSPWIHIAGHLEERHKCRFKHLISLWFYQYYSQLTEINSHKLLGQKQDMFMHKN